MKAEALKFVVCLNNAEYPASLELHKIYRAMPDEEAARDGDLRVIDESGESYLYPASWFVEVALPQAVLDSFRLHELKTLLSTTQALPQAQDLSEDEITREVELYRDSR